MVGIRLSERLARAGRLRHCRCRRRRGRRADRLVRADAGHARSNRAGAAPDSDDRMAAVCHFHLRHQGGCRGFSHRHGLLLPDCGELHHWCGADAENPRARRLDARHAPAPAAAARRAAIGAALHFQWAARWARHRLGAGHRLGDAGREGRHRIRDVDGLSVCTHRSDHCGDVHHGASRSADRPASSLAQSEAAAVEYGAAGALGTSAAGRIECQSVRKIYRDAAQGTEIVALDGLTLDIEPREFLTLLGPSGCGKSTLLNILAGFEKPDAGKVLLNGIPIERPGPDRGVVFQDYALFPWLNIQQNVEYGLREKGIGKAETRAIAQRFLDLVGLTGFERRYPHELSGGMRQRVALIRVLAIDPPRPRDSTSDAFNRYRREITQLIEVESRKVFAAAM